MFTESFANTIGEEMANHLIVEFSEEEVWNCIKSCDGNKSPGLDGFNMKSIKSRWRLMKNDVMNFLCEFHKNCKLFRCIRNLIQS